MSVEPVTDGQLSFEGGQDSSTLSSRLPPNKYAAGINTTTEDGVLRSRYGYERKKLKFPPGGYSYAFNKVAPYEQLFKTGRFQAQIAYKIGNKKYLLVIINGVIFLIDVLTYVVTVLTLDRETQLDENAVRINHSVAGKYIVLHDFPSRPVIIEGRNARRSSAFRDEIPVSNLSVFNQSRLLFANAGNEFTAGDPVGNPVTPEAPITVLEITLPGSPFLGDVYQMASKYDNPITAMATLQSVDSTTGIGSLLTATADEIFAFDTTRPRDQWTAGQFGSSISDKAGIVGPRAFINVNSDLFFVSRDGQLRSLSVAQAEQKKWARVPMSLEVTNWVSYISEDLVKYTTVSYFKNKIFWSVRPYRVFANRLNGKPCIDVAHSGFVVLETDNVARAGSDSPAAWAGLWTGIRPMDMCELDGQFFVMSKDYYNQNNLYEVDPELKYDRTMTGQRRKIKTTIYTRGHDFQKQFTTKNLTNVMLGIEDIKGDFEVSVDFKPSHSSQFMHFGTFKHCVPVEYQTLCGGDIRERDSMSFKEITLGMPDPVDGHPVTRDLYSHVRRVQFRITLTGDSWTFSEYAVNAVTQNQNMTEFLDDLETVSIYKDDYSDWTYEEFGR